MAGLILLGVGGIALIWRLWYWPSRMSRIRDRLIRRDQPTLKFDTMLLSKTHQTMMTMMLTAGIVGVIAGTILIVVGE